MHLKGARKKICQLTFLSGQIDLKDPIVAYRHLDSTRTPAAMNVYLLADLSL